MDIFSVAIEGRMMQRGSSSVIFDIRVCTFGQKVIEAIMPHV